MGKQRKQWLTLFFLGSQITADGDFSYEIKRPFLLGRKVTTKLDSILKRRDITLPKKVRLVKAMVFPVVMYGCESWTIKKAECQRIGAFELRCWRRLLRVLWTARRSNWSILKEMNIHWKDWCWNWNSNTLATWCEELTDLKRPWCWERLTAEEKGTTEDEMVGWHHQLNGQEFEQALESWWRREARCAAVHGVTKSRTWLSNWTEEYLIVFWFSHSVVSDCANPWTVAHQVPLFMEFPRQEYWTGLAFPSPIVNITS